MICYIHTVFNGKIWRNTIFVNNVKLLMGKPKRHGLIGHMAYGKRKGPLFQLNISQALCTLQLINFQLFSLNSFSHIGFTFYGAQVI